MPSRGGEALITAVRGMHIVCIVVPEECVHTLGAIPSIVVDVIRENKLHKRLAADLSNG
jgi:hypothetical protein